MSTEAAVQETTPLAEMFVPADANVEAETEVVADPSTPDEKPDVKADDTKPADDKPVPAKPPEGYVPQQALAEERAKRKAEAKAAAELRERVARLEGRAEGAGKSETANPEDAKAENDRYFANPAAYIKEAKEAAKREAVEEIRQENLRTHVTRCERRARAKYDDYDEVVEKFSSLAEKNPALLQMALNEEDPVEWGVQYVKEQERVAAIGDIEEWKKAEAARIRAEVEQELKAGGGNSATAAVTPTIADSRSVGDAAPAQADEEDALLSELFKVA